MLARRWPFVLALVLAAPAARSQSPAAAGQPPAPGEAVTVGVSASRVAVDLVVRDKKGRVVRDLSLADVELLEDGVPQNVLSLRLVDTGAPAVAPATVAESPAARSGAASASQPGGGEGSPLLLAFLFDRLSPQARRNAHDAALDWLQRPAGGKRLVGVFRIDQRLDTVLAFSEDRHAAEQALDALLKAQPSVYQAASDREQLRGLREQAQTLFASAIVPQPGETAEAGSGTEAGENPGEGAQATQRSMAAYFAQQASRTMEMMRLRSQIAMLEAEEALERDQQGMATLNSILALVNGLKTAPGRKAVVFFSEGLVVPTRVASTLRSVIAEANRGGVTFYTADATGLRTVSTTKESRDELQAMTQELEAVQAPRPNVPEPGSGRAMTKVLERNEDILRSDPHGSLGVLASETGGFLISDTNEIGRGLQAVADDLSAYYLVEYAPSNELWDGRFRRIEVRVKRPGVHVQARQGYFAVKTTMPTPLLDYEAPVLAAAELAPRARDLVFRAAAVRMPDQVDESAVAVVVEVPGDSPTLELNQKDKRYQQEFTVLVLVRDEAGQVVRKLSRRLANYGPLDRAEEARRSRVLVLRETWLPPGRYSVETAVQDAVTGKLGVQQLALEIPDERAMGMRVGSVVVVGHVAPRVEGAPEAPSLVLQGQQIYPNAGGPISLGSGRPIG
ncbi:MAG TPA: VWA domain-containing protein, partial [Vicinamibacteria bacterium]|nr:VWA domain-containing protein [Vicinamibacteria bacterium]